MRNESCPAHLPERAGEPARIPARIVATGGIARLGIPAASLLAGVLACGGGGAGDLTAPQPRTFAALTLSSPSLTVAVGASVRLAATPRDQSGQAMSGLPAATFSSEDGTIAGVTTDGVVTGVAVGQTVITASLTAGGVTRTAAANVTVTEHPPAGGTTVTTQGTTFVPATVTVPLDATVTWQFSGATHNVTFTGPAPPGGDIPDQPPGGTAARTFDRAGTYAYECTRHAGMSGQVVVQGGAAPVYSSLDLAPATPSLGVGGTVQLTAAPRDQFGNAMTGLGTPSFASDDTGVATVSGSGLVTGVAAGTATITASLTAGGTTHTATSVVTVTSSGGSAATVTTPNRTFSPGTATIPVGGTVTWQFSESTHNVTFTGAAPAGGNIPDQAPGNSVSRTFDQAGTYDYHCTRHGGMTGTVVVGGAPPPPPSPVKVRTPSLTFDPDDVTIAPGESVTWEFSGTTHNVTFESLAPPGGNIPDTPPGASVARTFPAAGDYDYECSIHGQSDGMKGRVRVR